MNICYFLAVKPLDCLQLLEKLEIKASQYQELVVKKNILSSLISLDTGSILAVKDFNQLGSNFSEILNNLHLLSQQKITLVCLKQKKEYSGSCPEYSFLSTLYQLKLEDTEKIKKLRLATIQRNNTKPGRQRVYNDEVEIMISSLKKSTDLSVEEICRRVSISKSTYYKYFNKN